MKAGLLFFAGTAAAVAKLRSHAFLGTDMQPEAVAHTLLQVEDEWRAQAAAFAECNSTLTDGSDISECRSAPEAFQKSCTTVVSAVVKASSGKREDVEEYMGIVCGESELSGWHQERCGELASSVVHSMSDENYENRENFNAISTCSRYWTKFAAEEKVRVDHERAEREAAEKKAEEERIAEQKRLAKEEAELKAADARRQAEAAASELEARKAEAERQTQEAKKKMEEAQAAAEAAARHHREALANATEAVKKFNASATNLTHAPTNVTAVKADSRVTANVTE